MPDPALSWRHSLGDPYLGVTVVLLSASVLGSAAAIFGWSWLGNPVLFDVAVTLVLSSGIFIGVAAAQMARSRPPEPADRHPRPESAAQQAAESAETTEPAETIEPIATIEPAGTTESAETNAASTPSRQEQPLGKPQPPQRLRVTEEVARYTVLVVAVAIAFGLWVDLPPTAVDLRTAAIGAAGCLAAAGLEAVAAHYFSTLDLALLPEAAGLRRWGIVVSWIFALAALSCALQWANQQTPLRVVHFVILATNCVVRWSLLRAARASSEPSEGSEAFPLDIGLLSLLGSRPNIVASILDTIQRKLGIDLRSTWALRIVRQSLEPLVASLGLLAWLSTSLTVVALDEQGLVERFGTPLSGAALEPGLHLHWPWPVDRLFRFPVRRVQALSVGHEGQQESGPENVLWAQQHAENEYTLLLGNGRDLITVDAAVQFRIADPKAWHYHCQNPAEALRAIAYRAVMRSTVNRTLADALSQNVVVLAEQMRSKVQEEADALGLGVQIVAFTLGGMHPPVAVSAEYQAVVSAEIAKVTDVVNAQVFRNETVPAAQASVLSGTNRARAEGIGALARAAGEAWSFRTLESQYRVSPEDYFFRRRLETLESGLARRRFTVVDARIQRDGGDLWLTP